MRRGRGRPSGGGLQSEGDHGGAQMGEQLGFQD